jgi:hypothetical protein
MASLRCVQNTINWIMDSNMTVFSQHYWFIWWFCSIIIFEMSNGKRKLYKLWINDIQASHAQWQGSIHQTGRPPPPAHALPSSTVEAWNTSSPGRGDGLHTTTTHRYSLQYESMILFCTRKTVMVFGCVMSFILVFMYSWYCAECAGLCISRLVLEGDRKKLSCHDWDESGVFQYDIDIRGGYIDIRGG